MSAAITGEEIHFVKELIQNAFDETDVEGICAIKSAKRNRRDKIGWYSIGFKSDELYPKFPLSIWVYLIPLPFWKTNLYNIQSDVFPRNHCDVGTVKKIRRKVA